MFRGREMAHTDLGRKILDRLVVDLGELAIVEAMPKQEGRNMIMVIGPNGASSRSKRSSRRRSARRADLSVEAAPRRRREEPAPKRRVLMPSRPQPTKGRAMPKMKSHSATSKRFRVTRKGKVLHRKAAGQPHAHEEERQPPAPCRGHGRGQVHRRAEEDQATVGEVTDGPSEAIRPRQEEAP